jgi:hypothetical protein
VKVQSDIPNTDALLDPSRLDPSRLDSGKLDIGIPERGLAADGRAASLRTPSDGRTETTPRDPGEDVLRANVWPDASARSLVHFASGLDTGAIAPDAQALDRAAEAILAGLVD